MTALDVFEAEITRLQAELACRDTPICLQVADDLGAHELVTRVNAREEKRAFSRMIARAICEGLT